jgi:Flp pilus assembly protein TadG
MKSLNRIHRDGECAQSLLETAFMLLVIFMVVFWIIEMCGMMYTYATIANSAEEGVRYGIVRTGVVANDSRIVTRVKDFAGTSAHDVSRISVDVSLPDGGSSVPNRIRVTVSYTYVPWLNNIVKDALVMHAYAEGRMVVQ